MAVLGSALGFALPLARSLPALLDEVQASSSAHTVDA
jgi:hypothetical protein